MRKAWNRGFTLLEIIAVVVVIGILVAILVPNLRGVREDAKAARAQADLNQIRNAIETYIIKENAFPATLTALVNEAIAKRVVNKTGPDPYSTTGADYQLVTSGSGTTTLYAVISIGPNGTADVTTTKVATGTLTDTDLVDDIVVTNCKRQ